MLYVTNVTESNISGEQHPYSQTNKRKADMIINRCGRLLSVPKKNLELNLKGTKWRNEKVLIRTKI